MVFLWFSYGFPMVFQEIHDPIDAAAHQLREAQKKQAEPVATEPWESL